uniref:Uncharacterized protein n=1 Tax=Timema tahoe TaxID=61484 RepID=A0A7R9NWR0_9NEOP|nr:unnamed protein product [Timema tahoe]
MCRFEPTVARYVMLPHAKELPSEDRFVNLGSGRERFEIDDCTWRNQTERLEGANSPRLTENFAAHSDTIVSFDTFPEFSVKFLLHIRNYCLIAPSVN